MSNILRHLNPTPQFPPYSGPYQVGTTDIEISASSLPQTVEKPDSAPSTIAFRLFYPSQQSAAPSKPVRWISKPQYDQLASVWRFLGIGSTLSSWLAYALPHLTHVSLLAHRDAPLATRLSASDAGHDRSSSIDSSQWPLLIFSHGLGGNRNTYSYLLGSLASHGLIVAAPDHRDGSQPVAFVRGTQEEESAQVQYRTMAHKPNDDTFRGRDEQLKIRIWETSILMEALNKVNEGTERLRDLHDSSEAATSVLEQMRGKLDLQPGNVSFAGHSFGATTVIQLLKAVYYRQRENVVSSLFAQTTNATPVISSQITSRTPAMLLDPWALPLTNPAQAALRARPMPCYSKSGTGSNADTEQPWLTVMSEAFYKWRGNRDDIIETVSPPSDTTQTHSEQPLIFYPTASAHLSQSDFGLLFPRLTKYLAKADEPRRLIELNVRSILEVLRRRRIDVEEFDLEKDGERREEEEGWVDLGEGESHNDPILSKPGSVKGWNLVSINGSEDIRGASMDGIDEAKKSTAQAWVAEGGKRSSSPERVESGSEQELDGIIDSGKA